MAYSNYDTIADHLILEFPVLAVLHQAVQASDKLLRCFVLSLTATVEDGPLKNYVLPNLEELVKLPDDRVVLLPNCG